MNKCHICKHEKECVFYDLHDLVDAINCKRFVHITNFDKVTISPEALVKFLISLDEHRKHTNDCPFYENVTQCERFSSCENCITKWLKQEVRDEE